MNNTPLQKQAAFLKAVDNTTKLRRIYETVSKHFLQHESILITVNSAEVATYIDQLLWRLPEEGFIPHTIANSPVQERVVITTEQKNLNQAPVLFNLCPQIVANVHEFQLIYDLLDMTHPDKERASRERQRNYQTAGFAVIER
jgi:DNA polymerase-3 subunit chi